MLTLLVRTVLLTSAQDSRSRAGSAYKPSLPGDPNNSLAQICTNQQLIEDIGFLVKVEDKKQLQQMGIDTLALLIAKAPTKAKTETIVMKELGVQQGDAAKQSN